MPAAGDLPAEWQHRAAPARWLLEVVGAVSARSTSFRFLRKFENLECLARRGTEIADNDGEVVRTPFDDCVLVMPSLRQLRAGVTVVRLAKRKHLMQ